MKKWYIIREDNGNELFHHGIKGQKWGVRRYQNEDGTLTDARKGLAVILENGGAGATRNNVRRLIDQNKDLKVFMLTSNSGDQYVKNILEELDKGG